MTTTKKLSVAFPGSEFIRDEDGYSVAIAFSKVNNAADTFTFIQRPGPEIARRLAACWNACSGIPTEQLEVTGGLDDMFQRQEDEAKVLRAQRDELLAALREIAEWTERYTTPGHPISTAARAVIAKVEG